MHKRPNLTLSLIGQGHHRVIIYITLKTLYAKFQDHRTPVSGEEDFKRFLPYMAIAAILVM